MSNATETYREAAQSALRDDLILTHLDLVKHIVSRLLAQLPPGLDEEGLLSAGIVGLVEAARHFDPQRGVAFKTYAYPRIRGAVMDELRRNCMLPQKMLEKMAVVRRAYEEMSPPATVEALKAATGLTEEEILDVLACIRMKHILNGADAVEPLATVIDRRTTNPLQALEEEELKDALVAAIQQLPERERTILALYFQEELRLREIACVLKLSESRVSRLLNAALFQIGEYLRARNLVPSESS